MLSVSSIRQENWYHFSTVDQADRMLFVNHFGVPEEKERNMVRVWPKSSQSLATDLQLSFCRIGREEFPMEGRKFNLRREAPETRQGTHVERAQLSKLMDLGHENVVNGQTGVCGARGGGCVVVVVVVCRVEQLEIVVALVELGPKGAGDEQVQSPHMAHLSQVGPI